MFDRPSKLQTHQRLTPRGWVSVGPMATSAELTLRAADAYGISYREIPGSGVFELEYRGKKSYFEAQNPFGASCIALYATDDKTSTKSFLLDANLSTPHGYTILKSDPHSYWQEIFASLCKPIVVKPTHGDQGRQVYTNIFTFADFETAVRDILPSHPKMLAGCIVEEMFQGEEYRILATRKKVIGIINRKPANVIGDGYSTLQQLIDEKNKDPRRKNDPNNYLVTILVDRHVTDYLKYQNLTLDTVIEDGKQIFLRRNSNISTGGDSIDVTDIVHPSVLEITLKAINAIPGLLFAGVDFMTKDITIPQTPESYMIIEVNNSPGYSIHDMPYIGQNRHAAEAFLQILFPELEK